MSIEQDICSAIDIIASQAVNSLQTGTTLLATIVECINPITGKYKVLYQEQELIAYTNNLFIYYEPETPVWIYLKSGQLDEEITILNTTHGSQINMYNNLFAKKEMGYIPNETYKYKSDSTDYTSLTRVLKQSYAYKIKLKLGGIDSNPCKIVITIKDENNKDRIIYEEIQSVANFNNNNFNSVVINAFWGEVKNLIISCEGASLKELKIQGLNLSDVEQNLQGVLELNIQGLQLEASISFLGNYLHKDELKNFKFYWFVEDESVKFKGVGFHPEGGEGWKIINEEYQGMYIKGGPKKDISKYSGTFKCVAIMDNFTFTRNITVINENAGTETPPAAS